jgi:hypothetical protein
MIYGYSEVRYAPDIRKLQIPRHPLKESAPITEGFLYTKTNEDILNKYFHKE